MGGKSTRVLPRLSLSQLLAATVGIEKADEAVVEAATKLALPLTEFTEEQALQILEHLAQEPGIMGTSARFARARVHLRWAGLGKTSDGEGKKG